MRKGVCPERQGTRCVEMPLDGHHYQIVCARCFEAFSRGPCIDSSRPHLRYLQRTSSSLASATPSESNGCRVVTNRATLSFGGGPHPFFCLSTLGLGPLGPGHRRSRRASLPGSIGSCRLGHLLVLSSLSHSGEPGFTATEPQPASVCQSNSSHLAFGTIAAPAR